MNVICRLSAILLLSFGCNAQAEELVRIAVASNFRSALEELTKIYAREHSVRFVISSGASGVLYAQIRSGAPFDLFFSADAARPEQLERDGLVVPGIRFTYAVGRLVFWTPGRVAAGDLVEMISAPDIRTIAIANPDSAPYGAAALRVLERLKLTSRHRIVRGDNVNQAFQFAATGNAQAGFLALAQIRDYERANKRSLMGEILILDPALHEPIEQQVVQLRRTDSNAAVRTFLEFVLSEEGQRTISAAGYRSLTWIPPGCHGCEKPPQTRTKR